MAKRAETNNLKWMLRALRHPNYRLFFFGHGVSLLGTWIQQIAMSWLVYRLTHSVFTLGLIGFADKAPVFLLTPFAGVFLDRYSRYKTVILTQTVMLVQALLLGVLTLSGKVEVWHVGVLASLLGFANALDIPARQSLAIEIIDDKADLGNAIALNSTIFNCARLVGPTVGGILLGWISEGSCFVLNAMSFLFVLGGLLRMKLPDNPAPRKETRPLDDLKEGFSYAYHFLPMRMILLLLALFSLTGMPFTVLLPAVAAQIHGRGPKTLGLLMAATGAGALAAALFLAARKGVRGLDRWIFYSSMIFAVCLIGFAFSDSLALSLAFLAVGGFGMMTHMASSNTILQTIVPDGMRGRVMSLYVLSITGMAPFGSFFAGSAASRIGVTWTLAAGGLICLAGSLIFFFQLPKVTAKIHPIYARLGIVPEEAEL